MILGDYQVRGDVRPTVIRVGPNLFDQADELESQ